MIDNEIPKHRKKKPSSTSKSNTKSKHKHEYKDVLLIHDDRTHRASICKICGKIHTVHYFESEKVEGSASSRILHSDEIYEKYKYLEKYYVDDIWQKYVPVNQEGGE